MNRQRGRKGFTIVELVIVIAVIAILASVLIPTFSGMVEKAHYSNALQSANNQLKADAVNYTSVNGGKVPDDTLYKVDGYFFKVKDNQLVSINEEEYNELNPTVKNIIFLIPDGAGFGTYDIANALKTKTGGGVYGQGMPITHDAISGMTVEGLYLDEFMIATADTYQYYGSADGATDSTAAGTALLGGYKTNYLMCGVDHDANVRANLLEVCRLAGKSTGFVTTKCLIDATPCAGNVHLLRRPDQKESYQEDANKQYMVNGIDVLLAYGTDGGYYRNKTLIENPLKARDYGYTIVEDLNTLKAAVKSGATKVFSNILVDAPTNGSNNQTDYQANHIKYDIDADYGTDLTLMDMAKSALQILSENINDKDGFCLVIEGGAIDNAMEGRKIAQGVGDYLAFDEVFAYCVNWAKEHGETVVVACPDHDSGAIEAPSTNVEAYNTIDKIVDGLSDGTLGTSVTLKGTNGHSGQNVPVWLYAPAKVRSNILSALHIPEDTCADKVRNGHYYSTDPNYINQAYAINNSDISPAILKASGLYTFDQATEELFYCVNKGTSFGIYIEETETFYFINGEKVKRNTTYWEDAQGNRHEFACGYSLYLTNDGDDYGYTPGVTPSGSVNTAKKLHHEPAMAAGTFPNAFYVPRSALVEMGYLGS